MRSRGKAMFWRKCPLWAYPRVSLVVRFLGSWIWCFLSFWLVFCSLVMALLTGHVLIRVFWVIVGLSLGSPFWVRLPRSDRQWLLGSKLHPCYLPIPDKTVVHPPFLFFLSLFLFLWYVWSVACFLRFCLSPFLLLECVCCVCLFLGCARVGCFCMLACFSSLVCVHRQQVRRCSLPRPSLRLSCFCLPAACLLRARDGSGVLVQTVLVGPACMMLRVRLLRPPLCSFLAHSVLLVASYSRPPRLHKHHLETMADAQPKQRAARERREEQAEATRNVRARADAIETRADPFDLRLRQLDVRVQYIEQSRCWGLRDFECTKLFFQTMENNYAVAKGGFLAALIQEIRDHTAPACDVRLYLRSWKLTSWSTMGSSWLVCTARGGGLRMTVLTLCWGCNKGLFLKGLFLNSLSRQLTEPLILHMDRFRKELAQGKGKGKGGDHGGRGKGRGKGRKGKQPQWGLLAWRCRGMRSWSSWWRWQLPF